MEIEPEHDWWTAIERDHGYIRARLRLLATDEGGRQGAIASGYRSHWTFPPEVDDEGHDAPLSLEADPGERLEPGDEAVVRLHPLVPELWPPVTPGLRLELREGSRLVGLAEVIEAIAPAG